MTLNCLYSSPQAILKSSQIVTEHFVTTFTIAYASTYLQSWDRLLETWLALTIGQEISKLSRLYDSLHWLALAMLRATRACGPFLESPATFREHCG